TMKWPVRSNETSRSRCGTESWDCTSVTAMLWPGQLSCWVWRGQWSTVAESHKPDSCTNRPLSSAPSPGAHQEPFMMPWLPPPLDKPSTTSGEHRRGGTPREMEYLAYAVTGQINPIETIGKLARQTKAYHSPDRQSN